MQVTTEFLQSLMLEAPKDDGLTPEEHLVYAAVYAVFRSQGRNEGYVTRAQIARLTNTSTHSVGRTLDRLVRKGSLRLKESRAGQRKGNRYVWIHPDKAAAERQSASVLTSPHFVGRPTSTAGTQVVT